jgi:hypothetical protein
MKNPFIELDISNIHFPRFETKPIKGYETPKNETTNEVFPYCCGHHKSVYEQASQWYKRFPLCCEEHQKIAKQKWFKKSDFENIPNKIVLQLSYTEYHISERINKNDWYKDITDYIHYNVYSFGQPAIGVHLYLGYLKIYIESKNDYPKNKIQSIIEYINTYYEKPNNNTSINILFNTYRKWLKVFPFEISFFKNMKPHFEKQLPILKEKPQYNKYLGISKAKIHTKGSLVNVLLNHTNNLLTQINTTTLYEKGLLTEPQKIKLELVLNERKMKLKQGYVNSSKDEEQRYRKILKEWFADEKRFIDEVTPIVRALPPQPLKTKAEILNEQLSKYDFFELEKVKPLTSKNKSCLIDKISKNGLPYAIAMFDFLQFIQYLEREHFKSKYKLNKEVSKWFDSDKDGRAVKGNISSLLKNTTENKDRYTAHKHKENVIKDYELLK